jgi:hypothetical protein
MINRADEKELAAVSDKFDEHLAQVNAFMQENYNCDIRADWKKLTDDKKRELFGAYKKQFLQPILEAYQQFPTTDMKEKDHFANMADQLDQAWDEQEKAQFAQESYNVAQYLPLSTLDFPALVKQYIRFLGKELMPIQAANSVNIEQRIFTKFLVNNQTGEEYEVPRIYFEKDADGTPAWRKIWNAGKGWRLNNKDVLTLATIQAAPNKKYSLFQWLLDDAGNAYSIENEKNVRTRLSYDTKIKYVQIAAQDAHDKYTVTTTEPADWSTSYTNYFTKSGVDYVAVPTSDPIPTWTANKYYAKKTIDATPAKKVLLPKNGIALDIQTGGTFLNGGITENTKLAVVDPVTNVPTGEIVTGISDLLSGQVDFVKGTISVSSCGVIDGIYVEGHISNETNLRTIGFREYPEIRKFTIADGCRFQLPFTVEDFAEATASLNFNLYNRLVQELVVNSEFFEDQGIVDYLANDFRENDGVETDALNNESYTHTEYADLDPTAISPTFSGNPFEYRSDAIHNAIGSVIYELCDRGKLDNLGFVIYCNPKAARLLKTFVTWTMTKSTDIKGVQMNYACGIVTDSEIPTRVVSSNRIDAYISVDAGKLYGDDEDGITKEYFFNIVAYPMDNFHITYKHLRSARHLTNSPENAAYADAQNPGGAAALVTTSSQYENIKVQGIQGRVICKNTKLVPDLKAGIQAQ